MVNKSGAIFVILAIASLGLLYAVGEDLTPKTLSGAEEGDIVIFNGLCVYNGSFSVLFNGSDDVKLSRRLEAGKVYTLKGKLSGESWVRPLDVNESEPEFPLETFEGALWKGRLITEGGKLKLSRPIGEDGHLVVIKGLLYGSTLFPLEWSDLGKPEEPMDGYPFELSGTVLYGGNPATLWGGEEVIVYLPYGLNLSPGEYVKVNGIAALRSVLTVYVEDAWDVERLGEPPERPLGEEDVGEVAVSKCAVVTSSRFLKLNCTDLRLYNARARVGDVIQFRALRRKNSLYALDYIVVLKREALPNSICSPGEGVVKIAGKVEWVKEYKNGFGLANVSENGCWVLLKLPKRLGVTIKEKDSVTAFGEFTTYRGMPAFEVKGWEDVCLVSSSSG